jgi:pimeloyl-ACP methyl ester carboxylesterase
LDEQIEAGCFVVNVRMTRIDFPAVCLLHGLGGSPSGSVLQLEAELHGCAPEQIYVRPLMPYANPNVPPSESVEYLRKVGIPDDALIVGISLGGLVAAKLQESERSDLHVICISSPTHAGDIELHQHMDRRIALYCSADPVIAGRTELWPRLALAYDLPWLTHDTDQHKRALAKILCEYLTRRHVPLELSLQSELKPLEER